MGQKRTYKYNSKEYKEEAVVLIREQGIQCPKQMIRLRKKIRIAYGKRCGGLHELLYLGGDGILRQMAINH